MGYLYVYTMWLVKWEYQLISSTITGVSFREREQNETGVFYNGSARQHCHFIISYLLNGRYTKSQSVRERLRDHNGSECVGVTLSCILWDNRGHKLPHGMTPHDCDNMCGVELGR